MKNSVNGFTLIELIVVVAIIGLLAAILVPSLVGYLGEAKLSTANANAKLAYTNTATYASACESNGNIIADGTVNNINLFISGSMPTYNKSGTVDQLQNAIICMMGSNSESAGFCSVKIDGGMPEKAAWAKTQSDNYVGHYPDEATRKGQFSLNIQ